MRRRALVLLWAVVAACGRESPPPAPPKPPPAETRPVAATRLLPEGTFVYIEAASAAALVRDAPWATLFLGRPLPSVIEQRLGIPADLLDDTAPLAFAVAGAAPENAFGVLILPVRDAERARQAAMARGSTVRAEGTHVGVSSDPRYAPGATRPLPDLPPGTVRGRVDLAPLVRKLDEVLARLPAETDALRAWLGTLQSFSFGARLDGDVIRLDLELPMGGAAEPARTDLREPISWLPHDAPLILAENTDMAATGEMLRPLFPILQLANPGFDGATVLEAWSALGRGAAASMSFGANGIEVVSILRAKDPEKILARYADVVRAQSGLMGNSVDLEKGPDARISDVTVHTLYARPKVAEDHVPRIVLLNSTVYAFRVEAPPAHAPADWAERDRAAVKRRLKALSPGRFEVTGDDGYLIVRPERSGLGGPEEQQAATVAEAAVLGRGQVRVRGAVDPDHPSYAAYRAVLDRALGSGPRAAAYPILPAARTKRDADAGEFGEGLAWCRIGADAVERMPRAFRQNGYLLVALDKVDLSEADVAWAYVAAGREGLDAPTRDVAYRLRDASVARARLLAPGSGPRYLAALIDGEVVAGARLDAPHSAFGDFKGLSAETARRLVVAMAEPPLLASYVAEGGKPESFLFAREEDAAFARVFGEHGIPIRMGAVGDLVFAVVGSRLGLAEEVIARLKSPAPEPQPGLLASLADAPDASVLVRVDLGALVKGIDALTNAMRPPRLRGEMPSLFPDLPASLAPCLLAGWREGSSLKARIRVDGRILDLLARNSDERARTVAEGYVKMIHRRALAWQEEHGTDEIPRLAEIDFDRDDPWGQPYRIEPTDHGFRVVSAGPDGTFGTADDFASEGD